MWLWHTLSPKTQVLSLEIRQLESFQIQLLSLHSAWLRTSETHDCHRCCRSLGSHPCYSCAIFLKSWQNMPRTPFVITDAPEQQSSRKQKLTASLDVICHVVFHVILHFGWQYPQNPKPIPECSRRLLQ